VSEQAPRSASARLSLPDAPNLDWLRKQAKRRLAELRTANPAARLSDAQFELAKQYGFPSWRALKGHVDALTVEGRLFDAARSGDVELVGRLLDQRPDLLYARTRPYEHTLLHLAGHSGRTAVVDLLLQRGLDVNAREKGDNTYAMHWAAAGGHLDVVRRLADAGGDVVGHGDDHELEVIGWATCWDGCDDDAHRRVADFLVSRGARHHVFSAIALSLGDEVRRIVAADPSALSRRMSRNENHRLPLHFAVRHDRPEMVTLLLELGADPLALDGDGFPAAAYATAPEVGRRLSEGIRARGGPLDLVTALSLGDEAAATRLVRDDPAAIASDRTSAGVLHVMAKRGHAAGVKWLLDHGANPNARWAHWDSDVTPLHLAVMHDHAGVVRLLLAAGADPTIRDTKHDSDAIGWAEFFGRGDLLPIMTAAVRRT
jgi:ankyrin repeat protein